MKPLKHIHEWYQQRFKLKTAMGQELLLITLAPS